MIDPKLLEILACPDCKGDIELWEEKERLVCKSCGKRYPIRDGIPIMLIDEAELPDGEQTSGGEQHAEAG
ncbi:MAG: Trm112 family protein [Armatimonadetes bacterium]|nr:Trm112 family protein [Armatimonadota bacterium]